MSEDSKEKDIPILIVKGGMDIEVERYIASMSNSANIPRPYPAFDHLNTDPPLSAFMAGDNRNWLLTQLEAWPTRVDQERTTNITYLMGTAAAVIRVLMNYRADNPLPPDTYQTPVETKAVAWDIVDRTVKAMGYKGVEEALRYLPNAEEAQAKKGL